MLSNFLRDNDDQNFVIMDFETCSTSLVNPDNLVWQLGVLIAKGKEIVEEKEFFVRWEPLKITPGAAQVTKFNKAEYLEKAEDPKIAFDYITEKLYNPKYRIIYHNGLGFENYLYKIWCNKMGYKIDWSFLHRVIDTDALARGIKKGIKYLPRTDFLAYQYRMSSIIEKGMKTNLAALGRENKIEFPYENLHSALADVRLNKLIWDVYIKHQVDI